MNENTNKWEQPIGIQQATTYLYGRVKGQKHDYTFVIDTEGLDDITKPTAKVRIVVDNKIVKEVSIEQMIKGFFNL